MRDGGAIDCNAEAFRDLHRRQLPQPAEQSLRWSSDQDDLAASLDPDERAREERQVTRRLPRGDHGQLVLPARPRGAAVRGERTQEAAR